LHLQQVLKHRQNNTNTSSTHRQSHINNTSRRHCHPIMAFSPPWHQLAIVIQRRAVSAEFFSGWRSQAGWRRAAAGGGRGGWRLASGGGLAGGWQRLAAVHDPKI
jgi:hypothetical protein